MILSNDKANPAIRLDEKSSITCRSGSSCASWQKSRSRSPKRLVSLDRPLSIDPVWNSVAVQLPRYSVAKVWLRKNVDAIVARFNAEQVWSLSF